MFITETPAHSDGASLSLPTGFEKGQVYTPSFLAAWSANLLAEYLGPQWDGCILDPACGDGELLHAAKNHLPNAHLIGADIDAEACSSARKRLGNRSSIKTGDMLLSTFLPHAIDGRRIGAVISNPPWGADLLHSADQLRTLGYSLATGQFDSWSLFVEMSMQALHEGGYAVFILPDAIFSPEHAPTRRLLAQHYSIKLIARLGEGIFRGVYRGTTVLLVRKEQPKSAQRVEVFRLSKSKRDAVLSGNCSLQEIRTEERHYISQQRFLTDKECRWDIDVRETEKNILDKIEVLGGGWTDLFVSGRGVELSKRGLVRICRNCDHALPAPTRPREVTCRGCGHVDNSEAMLQQSIVQVTDTKQAGFMPLIVGEDIGRYVLSCSRQIKMNVPGINYKCIEAYSQERLLIRKTGVGLKATVTKRQAATNQVVFHYVPKNHQHRFLLYYTLGILSSRIMFAYHLRKSGENEWRSHPYVTPKSLKELPIPIPSPGSQIWRQAEVIAEKVKVHLQNGGKCKALDLEIEGLIAGMYRLDHSDLRWVKEVICSAQDLEPMRALSDFDSHAIGSEIIL
ncbi:N-6 DNA methylase [Paracoccus aerius]|uniref:site-specific DNA-methyltransferase (adenine-specific) n=1 Tax=Paracoccus aerius TaxID=1915382 RepID=A0ABS1SAB9_9RHOB|nr:N-6 DNA methylase [Paracoccus aerius]MBL3675692.1 N-6 DNA methylase [Paracoccus aerius]